MLVDKFAKPAWAASKLPLEFLGHARRYTTYNINRSGNPSRYEIFHGKKPKVNHLVPFAAIGYTFVPVQLRPQGKEDSRIRERCRIIGYGDDDELEEILGYEVLLEKNRRIIFSNDVIFKGEEMTTLPEVKNETQLDDYESSSDDESVYSPIEEAENTEISSQSAANDEVRTQIERPMTRSRTRAAGNALISKYFGSNEKAYLTSKTEPIIPKSLEQALKSQASKHWQEAMKEEIKNMENNTVWEDNYIPQENETIVKSRWVFAIQADQNGMYSKFKARLVAKGFLEKYGIDYDEVFAPVAKFPSIRTQIAVAAAKGWKIFQDDVKAAYLNAELEKPKAMRLPNGKIVLLKKALYGLKESGRCWFLLFKVFMEKEGFKQSQADSCIFIKKNLNVGLYVDDILTSGGDIEIAEFRKLLRNRFKLSDKGGLAKKYLGINIEQHDDYISVDQEKYLEEKLNEYKEFLSGKPSSTPLTVDFQKELQNADKSGTDPNFPYRSMVGSLNYAMMGTRFDISAAVSILSNYCEKPMVRRIYSYIKGN